MTNTDATSVPGQDKSRVFVSYSRKDMAVADRLESALRARGFEVLIDRTEIYAFEDWWKRIETLIVRADTIVFLLSPDAVSSDICAKEVAFAASLNKRFAPIVCRPVDGEAVPEPLRRLNFIFLDDPTCFEQAMDRLADALATDIAWVRKHTEFGEQARRWSEAGRPGPRGLLLRPPVLEEAEGWIAARPRGAPPPTEATKAFIAESRRAATRRRNILSASFGAGLLVALALAGLAYWQRGIALEQRDQALTIQSRFLADLANQRANENDAATGLLLAIEALPDERNGVDRPYAPEAELALFNAHRSLQESAVYSSSTRSNEVTRLDRTAFSPDGRFVVIFGGKEAIILNLETRQTVALKGHTDDLTSAVFCPDGKRVVTAGLWDKTARIWEVTTGRAITVLDQHMSWVESAECSPDGRRVVTASGDNKVRVWNADTGQMIFAADGPPKLLGQTPLLANAIFSPDGHHVLATSKTEDLARVWNAETGQIIADLDAVGRTYVISAVFSPDGRHVVTLSRNNTATIWDADTGRTVMVLQGHTDWLKSAAFDPDGRRIVTASQDTTARVWDIETGQTITILKGHNDAVLNAAFSADGRQVVTTSRDKSAAVWDVEKGEVVAIFSGHDDQVTSAAFGPDGRRVVTRSMDETTRLWHVERLNPMTVLKGHRLELQGAAFSPDGSRVVTASVDGTWRVWDAMSGRTLSTFNRITSFVSPSMIPAFSPDGQRILTMDDDAARVWDVASGREVTAIHTDSMFVRSAKFSPDGRSIAVSYGNAAGLWDMSTNQEIVTFLGHRYDVESIAFSGDGRRLATVSGESVRVWDIDAKAANLVFTIERDDFSASLSDAAFSPDSRELITADGNATRIWDIETQQLLRTLKGGALHATFSPDGRHVLTAAGSAARIWELGTGATVATLVGHEKLISSIQFSPDGERVVTASDDGTARIWRVFPTTQALVDDGKRIAPRCLTRAQREKVFLSPVPPAWCIEMEKWPYQTQAWKEWLRYMRAKLSPPFPDTSEWKSWVVARLADPTVSVTDKE